MSMFNLRHRHFLNFRPAICSLLLLAALLVGTPIAVAHADNARDEVRQSVNTLVNAPAYRMVATFTDLHTKAHAIVTLECVRPDAADLRYEQDGHITMETLAVGKKVYLRQGIDGKFKAFPGAAAELLSRMQSQSLQTFKAFNSVSLVGHQIINGEPTSVYKLDGSLEGARSSTQIWISDQSHLPLKADAVASVPDKNQHNKIVHQHVVTTFTYGSTLKLAPPNA